MFSFDLLLEFHQRLHVIFRDATGAVGRDIEQQEGEQNEGGFHDLIIRSQLCAVSLYGMSSRIV